jgi:serine/threonine protein kinase
MEYMNMGDLRSYLISIRSNNDKNESSNLEMFLNILIQISNGCLYLESNKIVHRDLAARNCLLNKDDNNNLIVKISDLGLARNIYTKEIYEIKNKRPLPLRWMAPESIFDAFFTSKSDVWSFGILVGEIFNFGVQPYFGMSINEIIIALKSKSMPQLPNKCPNEM